ncbi:MAG: type II/IV secretion system protein [Parcubacteria group bacterium]|nr:type II/IV secretion system protein [Parcubacteria group bacterium]
MPIVSREEALKKIREKEIEDVARLGAKSFGLPYIDLLSLPIDGEALKTLPEEEARKASAVVFGREKKNLKLALLDPEKPEAKKTIEALKRAGEVSLFLASPRGLERFLEAYKNLPLPREKITSEITLENTAGKVFSRAKDPFLALKAVFEKEKETSELLDLLFAGALELDASDIHIESGENQALIRLRLDGILVDLAILKKEVYQTLRDRLKLVAGLKINIQEPQDGRFTVKAENKTTEVRLSSIPGPSGENLVLRILNPEIIQLQLEDLGLRKDDEAIIERELKKPNGMILVTGPTGSGKTTTLYACLRKINAPGVKIITIEDPIEYHLRGVEQTQVEERKGYTFAEGLKAILRQDPDVILVGEIRDLETAQTAIHASLTGHLVFSTLHTNNAAGTIPRIIDLGVKPEIIPPALNIAIAQRLLRRLCKKCSKSRSLTHEEVEKISQHLKNLPRRGGKLPRVTGDLKIKEANPKGCSACSRRGYQGRIGVFELFLVEDEMEKLIHTSPAEEAVFALAKKLGMVTMMQDALLKVLEGVTDLSEVERVIGAI